MRNTITLTLALLCSLLFVTDKSAVHAVPVTGGTGPGGIGTTSAGADLAAWFRSDQGLFQDVAGTTPAVSASDPIGRWSDLSGHGRHATQATATRRPTLTTGLINSNVGVSTTNNDTTEGVADDQFLDTPNFGLTQAVHVFTSFKFNSGDVTNPSVFDGLAGNTLRLYTNNAGGQFLMHAGGGNLFSAIPGTGSIFHDYGFLYNLTSSTFRVDGSQLAAGGTLTATNPGGVRIGGSPFADQDANSDFLEMAVFDRAMNSVETAMIENYMSARSSVAMTGTDRYAGDDPGNGDYDLDVFGIGRDASSVLDNSGSNGLGFEDPGGTTLDVGDYLLAGHKVESNALTSLGVPAGEAVRMQRVWYVDRTDGDDGLVVDMAFDFSDAGIAVSEIVTASLLFSSSEGPFSFAIVGGLTTSILGDTVTFAIPAGTLVDGYYTIAITKPVPEPSSFLLLGLGALGLVRHTRRRRSRGA